MRKPIVVIESPLAGDVERNVRYLKAAIRDSLLRGEAPMASHGLYAQPGIFDDANAEERKIGMDAGRAFYHVPGVTCVVYKDLGYSNGMLAGVEYARKHKVHVVERSITGWDS